MTTKVQQLQNVNMPTFNVKGTILCTPWGSLPLVNAFEGSQSFIFKARVRLVWICDVGKREKEPNTETDWKMEE